MRVVFFSVFLSLMYVGSAQASVAVGTDAIKWLDNQGPHIVVQSALSSTSAMVFDAQWQQRNRYELGLKSYSGRMFSSVYYQAGVSLAEAGNTNDLGITVKIGYERSPVRHFVFFGTVQGEYHLNTNQMSYTPKLGAMFAF